jgi:hypothetical protein
MWSDRKQKGEIEHDGRWSGVIGRWEEWWETKRSDGEDEEEWWEMKRNNERLVLPVLPVLENKKIPETITWECKE